MAPELRAEKRMGAFALCAGRVLFIAAASAGLDLIDAPHLDLEDMDGMPYCR